MARAAAHEPTANPALASTGQPEPEGAELLIAAARDSLPLRGVTQQRRGVKHQTSPRSRPPASEPDAAPPSTGPKKKGPRWSHGWYGPPPPWQPSDEERAAGARAFGSPRH